MKDNNDIQNEAISLKPDWKDAPEWANWLAQDESGVWNWFEDEPYVGRYRWLTEGCREFAPIRGWKTALEHRPEEVNNER